MTAVYILISNGDDLFYEQLLVSLYSLRMHNPDLNVVVLVDEKTERTLHGKRSKVRELANEIKVVAVPEEYNPKARSRYIKTTCRNYLRGNLLFIDTDTIISEELTEIDSLEAEIACVLDFHAPLSQLVDGKATADKIKTIFKRDVSNEHLYFNSGVIFMRDTIAVTNLFKKWNELWAYSAFEKGHCYDQPALMIANIESGHIIKELDGVYNCQILTSIRYLHKAKIIHFFNNVWQGKEQLSPFLGRDLYGEIKQTGEISPETKELIANCKSSFYAPTYFTCKEQVRFMNDIVGTICFSSYLKQNLTYRVIRLFCQLRYNIAKLLSRK